MDLSGLAGFGAVAYPGPGRTGTSRQSLSPGMGGLPGGAGAMEPLASFDPIAAFDPIGPLSGGSNSQALVSLGYSGAADSGGEGGNVQAMLAALGGGPAFNFPGGTSSVTGLFPVAGQGQPRTPYAPSPDSDAAQQAVASIHQFLATSSLNLLA